MPPPPLDEGGPPTRRFPGPDIQAPPPTQRLSMPPDRRARWLGLVGIALIFVALLGGGYFGYANANDERDVVVRGRVTSAGGGLTFDDGGRIEIPPGALTEPTTITVRRVRIDRPVRLSRGDGQPPITYGRGELSAYSFEPSDLTFRQQITIALPARNGGALLIARGNNLRVIAAERRGDAVVITTQQLSFG
ncbi:MAG: hypothetical protein WD646_03560 [Actinomycetota bacterium]